MPLRYRPYYPRRYNYNQNAPTFESGMKAGKAFGESLIELSKAIQQAKQNQVANQITNTQFAPRAALVAPGVSPTTGQANVVPPGTNVLGSPPATGGVAELKLRDAVAQQQQRQQAAQVKMQLAEALARAKTTSGKSPWTGRGDYRGATNTPAVQKPGGKYEPNSYNAENGTLNGQKTPDSMGYLRADVDEAAGKGTTDKLLASIPNLTIDPKTGKYAVKPGVANMRFEPDGSLSFLSKPDTDPNTGESVPGSGTVTGYVPANVLNNTILRYNAMQVRNGGTPLPNANLKTQNPQTTFPAGDQKNPYVLGATNPNLTWRSLPIGSYYIGPDGKPTLKPGPGTQTQTTPPAQTDTSKVPPLIRRPTADVTPTTDTSTATADLVNPQTPDAGAMPVANRLADVSPQAVTGPITQQGPQIAGDATLPNTGVVPTQEADQSLLTDLISKDKAAQDLLA